MMKKKKLLTKISIVQFVLKKKYNKTPKKFEKTLKKSLKNANTMKNLGFNKVTKSDFKKKPFN